MNFKYFFLLPILCALQADFTPENTEFAWDCHQVLLQQKTGSMVKIGLLEGTPKVLAVIAALSKESLGYCWSGTPNKTYKFLRDVKEKLKVKGVTAEDFKDIVDAYDATLWPLMLKIASQQQPMPGMQEIVDALHEMGYSMRTATNMSVKEFKATQENNQELFEHFQEDGFMVDVTEENFPRKPSVAYFEKYHARHNAEGAKKIIFIDDKLKNCSASQKTDMTSIHFKNAQQLIQELAKLGIIIRLPKP
jgi:HAD superfamily hydrolase (TIGR01509 family)